MARLRERIRSIKPEIRRSASLARCSRDARLVFILLTTLADDEGRFEADPEQLRSDLFPREPLVKSREVSRWLSELSAEGMIGLYEVDEIRYGVITRWKDHQRIDHPGKSLLPQPPNEFLANPRESSRNVATRARGPGPGPGTREVISPNVDISNARESRASPLDRIVDVWNQNCQSLPRLRSVPSSGETRKLFQRVADYFEGDEQAMAASIRRAAGDEFYRTQRHGFAAWARHLDRWDESAGAPGLSSTQQGWADSVQEFLDESEGKEATDDTGRMGDADSADRGVLANGGAMARPDNHRLLRTPGEHSGD